MLILVVQVSFAYAEVQAKDKAIEVVGNLFLKPASEISLLQTLLTFEKIVDPTVDINQVAKSINGIIDEIKKIAPSTADPLVLIPIISKYLYEGGYWNGNEKYSYDFNDPLGTKLSNKLISNYIKTKRGNCVSMPMLYLVLADKLGLDATLAHAPLHNYVKIRDEIRGVIYSIEATHVGQISLDEYYRNVLNVSPSAIKNGVFLAPLSRKQVIGSMATIIVESLLKRQQWETAMGVCHLILKQHPQYANIMAKIGNCYYKLLQERVAKARNGYTAKDKEYMDSLYEQNIYWFERAESLGWTMPTNNGTQQYLEKVKMHKKTIAN